MGEVDARGIAGSQEAGRALIQGALIQGGLVKEVMDHADSRKDDQFQPFAATAPAQVPWRLSQREAILAAPHPGPRTIAMQRTASAGEVDFFISHAGVNADWAEWVAGQLVADGFTVELAIADWMTGDDIMARMNEALKRCRAMVALWSRAYFAEGSDALRELKAADKLGKRIIPLRIEDFQPEPMWLCLRYEDLFCCGVTQARVVLAAAVSDSPAGIDQSKPFPAATENAPLTHPGSRHVPPPPMNVC